MAFTLKGEMQTTKQFGDFFLTIWCIMAPVTMYSSETNCLSKQWDLNTIIILHTDSLLSVPVKACLLQLSSLKKKHENIMICIRLWVHVSGNGPGMLEFF